MDALAPLPASGVTLVIGLPERESLLGMIARLALGGPVRVVVGGNRFDAYRLARLVRRHTVQVDETLGRVQVVRPFTCYQTVTLLAQSQGGAPLFVLDLLATFADDNVSDRESARLLRLAATHLRRCGKQAPVLVTARPLAAAGRQGLLAILEAAADRLLYNQPPPTPTQQSFWPKE